MQLSTTIATPATPARAAAEQRAIDQASQKLIDRILALRFQGGQTVSAAVAVVPEADVWLRRSLIESRQESPPRQLVGGIVEVEVWVTAARLRELIDGLIEQYLPKADRGLLELTGVSTPVVGATGRSSVDATTNCSLPGWRYCDTRMLDTVRLAAAVDLRHKLLGRIEQWRLSAQESMGDLMTSFPEFREALERRIADRPVGTAIFEPAGLCRLPAEVPRADILALLVKAAGDCGASLNADLSRAVDPEFQDPVVLDGLAVAPTNSVISGSAEPSMPPGPAWAKQPLSVTVVGQAPVDAKESQTRCQMALAAARLEAKRQLWMSIEQLPMPSGEKIGKFLADRGDVSVITAAVETAMEDLNPPVYDDQDRATVALAIDLGAVWRILHDAE